MEYNRASSKSILFQRDEVSRIKQLCIAQRYKQCIDECQNMLEKMDEQTDPVHVASVCFYLALCYDCMGRSKRAHSEAWSESLQLAEEYFVQSRKSLLVAIVAVQVGLVRDQGMDFSNLSEDSGDHHSPVGESPPTSAKHHVDEGPNASSMSDDEQEHKTPAHPRTEDSEQPSTQKPTSNGDDSVDPASQRLSNYKKHLDSFHDMLNTHIKSVRALRQPLVPTPSAAPGAILSKKSQVAASATPIMVKKRRHASFYGRAKCETREDYLLRIRISSAPSVMDAGGRFRPERYKDICRRALEDLYEGERSS